ncbi:hypothetical protein JOL79_08810 [Microbispora sp. RL4-1S]|uniref:Uncharacterized protein n=1 Tax=Microbispora oryzae TaxID=2806554 RepID=A0A940WED3_9ACTN|nr:hypothetical protein [Microbispora oryzae]MBP2703906.1 hypothetical protein [Microbispora oryzae]
MIGVLGGCTAAFAGEVGVAGGGKTPRAVIWWCKRPDVIHVIIWRQRDGKASQRPLVAFSSSAIRGDVAELPLVGDRPGWKVESGDPSVLEADGDYVVGAWPDDGSDGSFGHTEFTISQAMNLKPDQVKLGSPGSVISRAEFLTHHRSYYT